MNLQENNIQKCTRCRKEFTNCKWNKKTCEKCLAYRRSYYNKNKKKELENTRNYLVNNPYIVNKIRENFINNLHRCSTDKCNNNISKKQDYCKNCKHDIDSVLENINQKEKQKKKKEKKNKEKKRNKKRKKQKKS